MAFVLDAYPGWSVDQLKTRCMELVRTAEKYQHISMCLAQSSPEAVNNLPKCWQNDIRRLIEAYSDSPSTPNREDAGT